MPEVSRNGCFICPWIADVLETSEAMSFDRTVAVVNASNERGLHCCVHFPESNSNEEEYKSYSETEKPFAVAIHILSLFPTLFNCFPKKSSWKAAL